MGIIKTLFRKLAIWVFMQTTRPRDIEKKLKSIGYANSQAKPATNDFLGILWLMLNE
ncbi:hypothetical protein [Methylomicrobium sp. Wu6]|uniref:hypothetical protein n=1 Tax=Methylomicrobium sp. Wu6 TaxID=3107928 RepID=UPI002DD6603C|nr:hypothetical protein [Methylomicrobium sp. Wu6]MEC4747796.1 hypothetical protein [Methylomicrobium sp. Wu6]